MNADAVQSAAGVIGSGCEKWGNRQVKKLASQLATTPKMTDFLASSLWEPIEIALIRD
jgi:hypothetical protein